MADRPERFCAFVRRWIERLALFAMLSLLLFGLLFARSSLQASLLTRRYTNSSCTPRRFGPLQFSQDGTFQLSIFEDLHFGESEY
jgi:hypothetical protein